MRAVHAFNLASGGLSMSFSGFFNLASVVFSGVGNASVFHVLRNLVS